MKPLIINIRDYDESGYPRLVSPVVLWTEAEGGDLLEIEDTLNEVNDKELALLLPLNTNVDTLLEVIQTLTQTVRSLREEEKESESREKTITAEELTSQIKSILDKVIDRLGPNISWKSPLK